MWSIILFILGFPVLVKGADFLVDGAVSLAKRFHISDLVIGMTVVALGTSAPELVVNLLASFKGTADLAVGNILGSNTANILLVLGVAALVKPLAVSSSVLKKEIPLVIASSLLFFVLANDLFVSGASPFILGRIDALIMLLVFAGFLYSSFVSKKESEAVDELPKNDEISLWKASFGVLLGLVMLTFGGNWIVDGAVMLAKMFGMTEAMIGLTVVAVGTSLPELATSVVAARKGNSGMAIGNAVGSNLFNLLWVLGACAFIHPIAYNTKLNTDIWVTVGATFFLLISFFIGKKMVLKRWQGFLMFALYSSYIAYLVQRG